MKRTFAALLAAIVVPLSANAVPIAYEFSATIEGVSYFASLPIPPDIQETLAQLVGKPIVGTFRYESDVGPPVLTTPAFDIYNGVITDLVASVAGFDVSSAVGSAMVRSVGQDRFSIAAVEFPPPVPPLPSPVIGEILGYEVRNFGFAWVEGVPQDNPVPPFLVGQAPPLALPSYLAQITVNLFVPGLAPPSFPPNTTPSATLQTLRATVRPVTVPEPSSLALLALGLVGAVASRRRADRGSASRFIAS